MPSIYPDDIREHEQQAEAEALTAICHENFTECLLAYHFAPSIEVKDGKGKLITITGSDISDKRTWAKFLSSIGQMTALYQLTDVVEPLAQQYTDWLLTKHTTRYHYVISETDVAWVKRVATLAITRHIMENKYNGYMIQKIETFAQPSIIPFMATIVAYAHLIKESARIAHRVFRNSPQEAQMLIDQLTKLYRTLAPQIPINGEPLLESPPSMDQEDEHEKGENGEEDVQDE